MAGSQFIVAATAGLCPRLTEPEVLSLPASRTARLLTTESSISSRIACRSSVAEITGNSKTSTHASASKHCSPLARRPPAARRHSQYPGSAKNTHARLSNNSISQIRKRKKQAFLHKPNISFPETPNRSQRDHSTPIQNADE
jgi:hypothetical protein